MPKLPLIQFFIICFTLFSFNTLNSQNLSGINTEWLERDKITGDWGGLQTQLEENGVDLNAAYKGEYWGIHPVNDQYKSCYTDNFDITGDFDLEKLIGLSNTHFFMHGLGNHGENIADYAGTAQGISNIAAYNTWKLFEIYFETSFFDNKLNVLAGMYDLNSQFDCKTVNQLFINPSHGIGLDWSQSGENGPSIFPTSSLGLRIKYSPIDHAYIQYSVLDGVPGDPDNPGGTRIILNENDGLLSAWEIGYTKGCKACTENNAMESTEPYSKFAIGYWYYTDNYRHLVTGVTNWGAYLLIEQDLYNEQGSPQQGLTLESRIGIADENSNQFDFYFGAGLIYTGLIKGRDDDELGFSVASAHNGFAYLNNLETEGNSYIKSFEHVLELTYKYNVGPALAMQPDLQYVIDPCHANSNNLVFGMRFIAIF